MATVWTFETAQFRVELRICDDYDLDLSWDETGETAEKLESGEWQAFRSEVRVIHKPTGIVLGSDDLWGSIYAEPSDFWTEHRSADPMNRNCTIMRAARGQNVVICHYFPGMVSEAIAEARKTLARLKQTETKAI